MRLSTSAHKPSKEHRVYIINPSNEILGDDVCNELLFYMRTQTARMIYGNGKQSAFRKFVKSDPVMKSCASAFILQNKYQEDISDFGTNP